MSQEIKSLKSPRDFLWEKIKDSKVAMLTSLCHESELHSRPMLTAQNEFDGHLYFFSKLSSEKIDEIWHNQNILLTYSHSKDLAFVSVYGIAKISRHPSKLRERWSLALEEYFPHGLSDSDLCLIEVEVTEAEYWDAKLNKVQKIFELVRASLVGEKPRDGRNGRIQMQ